MFKYLNFYIFSLLAFSFAFYANASILSFNPPTREKLGISQEFQVDLMIDTQGREVNAIEGQITYDPQLLTLVSLNEGGSVVPLWLPRAPREEPVGTVRFSGVIPNGFSGVWKPLEDAPSPGVILSFVFKPKKQVAAGEVEIRDARVILNDGKATPDEVSTLDFSFDVLNYVNVTIVSQEDYDPPEEFTPVVARDKSIFDGQYFVAFNTRDTGSGIDHYGVREEGDEFIVAESPYLLKNQDLSDTITVKAVDRAGNERIATVTAGTEDVTRASISLVPAWFWISVVIIGLILIIVWRATSKHFL